MIQMIEALRCFAHFSFSIFPDETRPWAWEGYVVSWQYQKMQANTVSHAFGK